MDYDSMLLHPGLRWAAILGVFFATTEVFARIDDTMTWGAPLLGPYSNDLLTMRDSFGIRGRPGYRFKKWGMNGAGFRGADLPDAPTNERVRIAVLGASETFGLYESPGLEYPAQLGTVLDSIAPGRFEVVNAGLPGMSLSAMVPYFRRMVAPIKPALVLVYPSPSFYLEVDALTNDYLPPARQRLTDDAIPYPRLMARGRDVVKGLIPTSFVTWYREGRLQRIRAAQDPAWVWGSVPAERMAILAEHLDRLTVAIQSAGVAVALVTHTNRFVGEGAVVTSENRRHLINLMSLYYPRASEPVMVAVDSAANRVVRRVAITRGVPVLEVEGRIPPTSEYFADYAHFTDAGAAAMARLIAAGVLALELKPVPLRREPQGPDPLAGAHHD